MEKFPKVFIIVLNYNGKDVIKDNLTSLMGLDYPNFEIVIVDNNSRDGSLEIVRSIWPRVHVIKNSENIGYAPGNNIGIKFSLERGAGYILLLNNDTVCEKDFLSKLIEVGENNKEIGILSPVIYERKTERVWFSGGKISWLRMKTEHTTKKISGSYVYSEFITGCAMLVKKEVFQKIGLLDENYFLYWEDADFSYWAGKVGFKKAVVPGSRVYHLEKSCENKDKVYWLVISGLIFFKKNSPTWIVPWIWLYVFLRKIKNRRDIKSRKDPRALLVRKAYDDFKKTKF